MWKARTEPVVEGTLPYKWDVESVYQCTWYGYFRALECGLSAPTWWDRATKTGSYTNAKDWLENYRDPWVPIADPNYTPVAGDILVYDGEYGHIIFMETDVLTSEYRNGGKDSFRNAKIGDYKGVLLGVLHYPYQPVNTVERNENADQIETTDEALRIRTEPSLNGEIVGHVQLGFYNVLDQKEVDGYTWYQIAKDRWCADITTKFYPKAESDFVEQIRKWSEAMINMSKADEEKISAMEESLKEIQNITGKWV